MKNFILDTYLYNVAGISLPVNRYVLDIEKIYVDNKLITIRDKTTNLLVIENIFDEVDFSPTAFHTTYGHATLYAFYLNTDYKHYLEIINLYAGS